MHDGCQHASHLQAFNHQPTAAIVPSTHYTSYCCNSRHSSGGRYPLPCTSLKLGASYPHFVGPLFLYLLSIFRPPWAGSTLFFFNAYALPSIPTPSSWGP